MGRGQSAKLPDEFAAALRDMYDRRPQGRTPINVKLCATVACAYSRGWSFASIGRALQLSREQVRRLANSVPPQLSAPIAVPYAPMKRRRRKGPTEVPFARW